MPTHCPVCKKEYGLLDRILTPNMCSDCHSKGREVPTMDPKDKLSYLSRSKYPALMALSTIYRIIAFVVGIAAIIAVVAGIFLIEQGGIALILGGALSGILGVVTNLAIAEGIKVLIDIENNTRKLSNSNQAEVTTRVTR